MKPATVTQGIIEALDSMRKSERKVATYVLSNANEVIHMRIVDLAKYAEVSEPTVVRFCRAVGYSGFQEFKLMLVQQLAASPSRGQIAITDTDSIDDLSHKVFDSTIDTLLKVRDSLDKTNLTRAIEAISQANRVEFYGFGASAPVAADAQHKFFRLQLATATHSDPHIQRMSAMSLQKGDVVVAISQSGRTSALLDTTVAVMEKGAIVIGLCPSQTPLSKQCSIPIDIDVKEDIEIYTPLSSRIAHLVAIDVLAIGVAQSRGPELKQHLLKMQQGLDSLRTDY